MMRRKGAVREAGAGALFTSITTESTLSASWLMGGVVDCSMVTDGWRHRLKIDHGNPLPFHHPHHISGVNLGLSPRLLYPGGQRYGKPGRLVSTIAILGIDLRRTTPIVLEAIHATY